MKVLFLEWNSFCKEDMLEAYKTRGTQVVLYPIDKNNARHNDGYCEELKKVIREQDPNYVFSFNYYPVVSKACDELGMPYVSWIYDSPYVMLYSCYAAKPCNHIYVFDKNESLKFQRGGISTVHYLPMAANVNRLDKMTSLEAFQQSEGAVKGDISFVGSLYADKDKGALYDRLSGMSEHLRGYLEGIMAAQKKVYGYNFIEELLTTGIVEELQKAYPMDTSYDGIETLEYLYAQYFINRQITATERRELLSELAAKYRVDLYTGESNCDIEGIVRHGFIDVYSASPYVYKNSKINLNISLRSIHTGIPLRCFDIMGAGGFLLSNYQQDFMDLFVPGEDFEFFDSPEMLMDKADYYLAHEDERRAIAENGHSKITQYHTFEKRIEEMESNL